MKNEGLARLDWLVGQWDLTMSDAWFMDPGYVGHGAATIEWLDDGFLIVRASLGADSTTWTWVIGRNDAQDAFSVLYHDERGVNRVFRMTFDDGEWRMEREDPDFHQRFVGTVEPDRILARTEASDDEGRTWRKDFDLTFERRRPT